MAIFAALGAVGCFAGWLLGEGVLFLLQPDKTNSTEAASLISRAAPPPDLEQGEVGLSVAPPALPPAPAVPKPLAVQPPEIPEFTISNSTPPPPPPEFQKRLEREKGQQSGDVRISLLWNNFNDLDLHCIDPRGEEIYYSHRRSASGGELDVDANVSPRTREPVENIYWPINGSPTGTYRLYVNYFRHHSGASPNATDYKVNLLVDGQQENFSGTISSRDGKRLIHTFTFGPRLQIAASPSVEIDQGGKNRVKVRIARTRFTGPVSVALAEPSAGVTIAPVTIPTNANEAELIVTANKKTTGGRRTLRLKADGGSATAEARFTVNVREVLPAIVLSTPPQVQVNQGSGNEFVVRIARIHFEGDVILTSAHSITGLTFNDATIAADTNECTIKLTAARTATGGIHDVKLVASGGGTSVEKSIQTEVIELTPSLRMSVPDRVDVVQGGGSRVLFNVCRDHFDGPIEAKLLDAPAGVSAAPVIVAAEQDQGEFALYTTTDVVAGTTTLDIVASSETVTTEDTLELVVTERPVTAGSYWLTILLTSVWSGLLAAGMLLALVVGQNRYLGRPSFSAGQYAAFGLAGGGVGGLAGASAQILSQGLAMIHFYPSIGFILGWTILGALVGSGLSYFVPNLSRWKAAAAGSLGGLLGALAFLAMSFVAGDTGGRLIGAVTLGTLIGLMVAVAEAAFRSIWLEVYRGNEMTLVTLGPEPIVFGSDRRATVWIANAPPLLFRFWTQGQSIMFERTSDKTSQEVAANFSETVGNVRVVVRGSTNTGPNPQPTRRPPPPPPLKPATVPAATGTAPTSKAKAAPQHAPAAAGTRDVKVGKLPPPPPPPPPRNK